MNPNPSERRISYERGQLRRTDAPATPIELFGTWYRQAVDAGIREPEGMSLATADVTGAPSCRIVLMRGFDELGVVFYTNYESRKGDELLSNPRASLGFWWPELERQVRFEGEVDRVSSEESDAYFASRPRVSQLSAWASPQSETVATREDLEREVEAFEAKWPEGTEVPRPPHWGGYRLRPHRVEFWQGRPARTHDRLRYERDGERWRIDRLAP